MNQNKYNLQVVMRFNLIKKFIKIIKLLLIKVLQWKNKRALYKKKNKK